MERSASKVLGHFIRDGVNAFSRGSLEEDLYIETRVKSKPLAKPVEEGHLIKKVPLDVELKHVRYFMDGIQRTILIGYKEAPRYVTVVPIHFHMSGAVIIEYDAQSGEHKLVEGPLIKRLLFLLSIYFCF